jgi:CreA protein
MTPFPVKSTLTLHRVENSLGPLGMGESRRKRWQGDRWLSRVAFRGRGPDGGPSCSLGREAQFVMRTMFEAPMSRFILAAVLASLTLAPALAQDRVGEVSTTFRVVGPNDKVVIDRFDDPKVENASCYVSRAETGGLSGWVGLAEDPSRFSIACRATGPVRITGDINRGKKGEVVFSEDTSVLFKEMRVSRFYDADKNVLVYLVWSTKLIDGSPFNSVTAIPVSQ